MSTTAYRRVSARVLLLDGSDHLLLFRSYLDHKRPRLGHYWLTPGGGVEDGELLHHAAARELREETGLSVAPDDLGPRIAHTSGYADLGWARGTFLDVFFLHRVTTHEVDVSGFQELERKSTIGYRWWSLDELASSSETVYPFGLVPLLTEVLAARIPSESVELPWHH
jgi:8-oxo-dGTP pyrophosphatase MutT (NUDIX family)